jgi:peptide/nickel transport system ATP-binding protein
MGSGPRLTESSSSSTLLKVQNLHIGVAHALERAVVRGLSFEVREGEVLGIVGESGSGKSMTALSIVGLLPPTLRIAAGSILFREEELTTASAERLATIRGQHIGLVFQDPMAALNPVLQIGSQVSEPLLLHRLARRTQAMARAVGSLKQVGIPAPLDSARRFPHEFSGGMRQRAIIATAVIATPQLIVADEPTTALDVTVQAQILDLFRRLNREQGVALVLISHDLGVVGQLCDRIAVMYAGRIVETGPAWELLASPQHPYTRALLDSMPSAQSVRKARLRAIPGEPPAVGRLPDGCPFHPRCAEAVDECRTAEPLLKPVRCSLSACWVAQGGPGLGLAPKPPLPATLPGAVEHPRPRPGREVLLQVENLRHFFPVAGKLPWHAKQHIHAVDGVSLTLGRGETLGIVGESGCGKSTVARCVLRLIKPDEGRIVFRGQDISSSSAKELRPIRRYMQPVFQDPYASLNARWRVRQCVMEPLLAQGLRGADANRRIDETLELVGLGSGQGERLPHELSGGQRQRVAIARALVCRPDLLVADEPLSSLDVSIQAQIINLLRDMQATLGLSILFVSHDLRVVRYLTTAVAVMYLGKVVEFGDTEAVCSNPEHPYTAALLSAVPKNPGDVQTAGHSVLSGELPSPMDPPTGCRFRTRCPIAEPICASQEPPLVDGFATRVACHYPLSSGKNNADKIEATSK